MPFANPARAIARVFQKLRQQLLRERQSFVRIERVIDRIVFMPEARLMPPGQQPARDGEQTGNVT